MARNYDPLQPWEIYVPDIIGDDGVAERRRYALEPDKTITVEIKSLSKRERDQYSERARRALRQGDARTVEESRMTFSETVRNIRNYSKDGQAIINGEDLVERGDQDICEDVITAVMNRPLLERGLAKKLRLPSATSISPATKRSDGDAVDATGASDSATPEILSLTTPRSNSTMPPSAGGGTVTGT